MQQHINQSAKTTAGKPKVEHEKPLNRMPQLGMPAMPPLGLITAIENCVKRRLRMWKHQRCLHRPQQEADLLDQHQRDDIGMNSSSVNDRTSSPCQN